MTFIITILRFRDVAFFWCFFFTAALEVHNVSRKETEKRREKRREEKRRQCVIDHEGRHRQKALVVKGREREGGRKKHRERGKARGGGVRTQLGVARSETKRGK